MNTHHRISRRHFMASSLAGAAALGWGNRIHAQDLSPDRWILLADTHIPGDRDRAEGKPPIKPVEKFAAMRTGVLALDYTPAGLLIAGDCVFLHGEHDDYVTLKEELQPLVDRNIPLHMSMGNHDNRERFWGVFPEHQKRSAGAVEGKHAYILDAPRATWFVLDSNRETDFTPGEFGAAQLEWLANELDQRPGKPALLMAHHYPEGENGLLDFPAFWNVIQPRKQVKAYFYGHSHVWSQQQREGIHFVNLPGLAWLFSEAGVPRAWVEAAVHNDRAELGVQVMNGVSLPEGGKYTLPWRT
ncbi:MAG TPA: metallophosphoesterase [Candidatus Hydrogenedentes bacterium]|nr:metallophosphoesterase [Candidatus Hydrogenedentota bacterium]